MKTPKILFVDIETLPLEVYAWQLKNYGYTPVNMVKEDWRICSFAAKWKGSKITHQYDLRNGIHDRGEKRLISYLRLLIDKADIVVTQNGKKFDIPMLYGRLAYYDIKKPSSFEHIDTLKEAKKYFRLPSYSLEYVTSRFCKRFKKRKHKKFPGIELWLGCIKGLSSAWKEMAKYNAYDVLSLEEWFGVLQPYMNLNFSKYLGVKNKVCACGSTEWHNNGHSYTETGKYKRWSCKKCGSELKQSKNLVRIGVRRVR